MNRFHVHLNVADLDASIRFYTELKGTPCCSPASACC